jgi:hypothetical protein
VVKVSLCWLQETYCWKRGSPQPGSLPKGNLRICLPHVLWQVCADIKEGMSKKKKRERKERSVMEGWMMFIILTTMEREVRFEKILWKQLAIKLPAGGVK